MNTNQGWHTRHIYLLWTVAVVDKHIKIIERYGCDMFVMVATPHVMLPKTKQYHASTIISENIYLGTHQW